MARKAEPQLTPAEHLQVLAALYDSLLRPVAEEAERAHAHHLVVVPDGPLCYVPLAMLVEKMPADAAALGPRPYACPQVRYALDRWDISYLPAFGVLPALLDRARKRPEPTRKLCVFADPVFGPTDQRAQAGRGLHVAQLQVAALADERLASTTRNADEYWRGSNSALAQLPRLPQTAVEARRALKAFHGASGQVWTRPQPPAKWAAQQVFEGLGAVEPRAYDAAMADYGYVLIATHGCIDPEHSMYSYLALTPRDVVADQNAGEETSPLADGRLTLGEILGMRLNARVVTLSACQTGLGRYNRGEGITGLVLAFLCAGAQAATVSLWSVDDARTAELIGAYHERMAAGKPPLQALLSAQRQMLAAGRKGAKGTVGADAASPYLWAPFVLVGQW